jgi:hypothetical protein
VSIDTLCLILASLSKLLLGAWLNNTPIKKLSAFQPTDELVKFIHTELTQFLVDGSLIAAYYQSIGECRNPVTEPAKQVDRGGSSYQNVVGYRHFSYIFPDVIYVIDSDSDNSYSVNPIFPADSGKQWHLLAAGSTPCRPEVANENLT